MEGDINGDGLARFNEPSIGFDEIESGPREFELDDVAGTLK